MKLALLPLRQITSKKTFLYAAASSKLDTSVKPTIQERIVNKAATTWTNWEAAKGGWKKKIVEWGNKANSRIDYREHCLKSVMSIAAYRRHHPDALDAKITVNHPASLDASFVTEQIMTMAKEGQPRHRQKLLYSFILMPFTAPFMLIPIIPNLPFFYVAFRAWSHWRALQGSIHLQLLARENRLTLNASKALQGIYDEQGRMVLPELQRALSERVRLPEMALEVERANEQLDRLDAAAAAAEERPTAIVSAEEAQANRERARAGLHK